MILLKCKQLMRIISCYSYVGRMGSKQDVSLGRGCMYKGTVVHELCHALGFFHESIRSARDSYISIHMENVESGNERQFMNLPPSQNHLYGPFDYGSIMMYGDTSFSKNGQQTMVPKQRGVYITNPYFKN